MVDSRWPAPRARAPLSATIAIPGSKSETNRALVIAALADGPSTIYDALAARDTTLMTQALVALGTQIDVGDGAITVTPGALTGGVHVDVGLAGTVMRFVPPIAALAVGDVRFDGDPRARVRPMGTIIEALEQAGVAVQDDGRGTLPFTVAGAGHVAGGDVTIDASASSQFISALLLASARFDRGIELRHEGPSIPSMPHIAMTIAMLADHGVAVQAEANTWRVDPGTIRARDRHIEPDLSNAAAFLAAALAAGGAVTVPRWPARTAQPGDAVRAIFELMGASVTLDDRGLTVAGDGTIRGIDVDLSPIGELAPTIAALAALADAPSRLRGIAHLRGHETDRLEALARELNALGGDVRETDDGLVITPRPLHGGVWHTYADHRMATAGALIGLVVDDVEVENVETTAKTLPEFVTMWQRLFEVT